MRPDLETATERVMATRVRLARSPDPEPWWPEIEDALGEGYAEALAADAWLAQAGRRLRALIDDASGAVGGRELRTLAGERAEFERGLLALREELAALRKLHYGLRARSHARSA